MKSSRLLAVLLAFFWVFAQGASLAGTLSTNDDLDYRAIDSYLSDQIRANGIPGAALAIVRGGQVVHTQGYGEASPGRAMSATTPMFIGSISKSFTAVAVMQLVEQGKISLDSPVQNYLPFFTLQDPEQSSKITVRHLLNQTSGLAPASLPNDALPENASLRDAVDLLATATLVTEPGTAFTYCNHNYIVLGLVVETVSGEPYGEYIQNHIFTPLGMEQSYISKSDAVKAGVAQGFNHFFGFPIPRPQPQPQWDLAAGYLISTAADMGKYLAFQLGNTPHDVLSAESLKIMHTPPTGISTTYAMGWDQNERAGIATIEHSGDVETFHANVVLLPGQDTAFILLYNLNGILQVVTVYNTIPAGVTAILNQQPPAAGVALWLVYMFLVILFLFDVGRKVFSLLRIPDWGRKALEKGKSQATRGAVIEIIVALLILFGVPLVIFLQAGRTALQLTLSYHTDIALYILLTSLLSIAVGLSRVVWLRKQP